MEFLGRVLRQTTLALCLAAASAAHADACGEEKAAGASGADRHFVVFAGRTGVFFERSGPSFVMLMRSENDGAEIGAFGIHADARGQPAFGAVPPKEYESFLREADAGGRVMFRVEVSAAQYARVLGVLRNWERRVRERALLYPDVALDNILLVKQASEELNRCEPMLVPYALDWGLEDDISEQNVTLRVPFEYFSALKRLNTARHVPDAAMPAGLLALD